MALLFMDGFDHYGSVFNFYTSGKWLSGVLADTSNTVIRTGTGVARLNSNSSTVASKTFSASGGFVVGFAVQMAPGILTNKLLQILEGVTIHLEVGVTVGGLLTVSRGATLLATGTKVLATNSWYYIEFKGTIHDTTGSYELRVDGVAELTATNVDTNNAGTTGQWNNISLFGRGSAGTYTYIDDLYICDMSGAAPRNNFLGLVKIETLMPQTDAVAVGISQGLTPSTGTDHGALVDEVPPNTTDYNSSPTVNAVDEYQYPSLSIAGTILGVQTNLYVQKSDATARTVCARVRTTTSFDGANVSPLTTFSYFSEIRPVNPGTLSEWTVADITGMQVGMRVTS